jgi:hypothetical protein
MTTKHFLPLALALCFCTLPLDAFDATKIPAKSQVILKANAYKVSWTPTPAELKQALKITQAYLANPSKEGDVPGGGVQKILGAPGFRVQAWGTEVDGKKLLHLNFFPEASASKEEEFPGWKTQEVMVMDGGPSFWNLDIDLSTGKVVRFQTNGYASLEKTSSPAV